MKIDIKFKILLYFIFLNNINANEIENLLNNYTTKNNFSNKTIDANKGHLILFDREKIEKMHAKSLKDIFKTTPLMYYYENRYALPDPLVSGGVEPYRSNFIRVFIDGVEVTQGWLGSGVMLYGDINIDFVDHIEFYYLATSYDSSSEPAYLTIFLYSKTPREDSGTKGSLVVGDNGQNSQSITYINKINNISYMMSLSHQNAKKDKVDNFTSTPLSRDFSRTQLFSYIKTDKQKFNLQIINKDMDSLAGMSYDSTPIVSTMKYLHVHLDYGINFASYWHFQLSYEWLKSDIIQIDDTPLIWSNAFGTLSNQFNAVYKNSTYSTELTYKRRLGKHLISAGIKSKYKTLDSFTNNNTNLSNIPFNKEYINSIFFQDQYSLNDKELLTISIVNNDIHRNGEAIEDELLQLRLGYIFSGNNWGYKSYIYRTQFGLEPLTRYLNFNKYKNTMKQTTIGFTQEISYKNDKSYFRLLTLLMKDYEGILEAEDKIGGGKTQYFSTILNYDYKFNPKNTLSFQIYYASYKDIVDIDNLKDTSAYISHSFSYDKFDFYNGIVWHRNNIDKKDFIDWTSSISWNINKDMTITIKGQNLLDKAKNKPLYRIDTIRQTMLTPLFVNTVDKRVTIELEHLF